MVEDTPIEQNPAEHAIPQDDRLVRLRSALSDLAQMQPSAVLDGQLGAQNERLTRLTEALGEVDGNFLGLEVPDDEDSDEQLAPLTEEQSRTVIEHMGIAIHLARRYRHRGQPDDDLEQVANIGLIKSVQRFDPERGVTFATFATPTILGELRRHFRDHGWSVRVPRQIQERVLLLRRAQAELTQKLARTPTISEVAAELGIDEDLLHEAYVADNAYSTTSLDQPLGGEDSTVTLEGTIGQEGDDYEGIDNKMWAEESLALLDPRERTVITARAGMPPFDGEQSQAEIAEMIGVSQMQVSRIIYAALLKLSRATSDNAE